MLKPVRMYLKKNLLDYIDVEEEMIVASSFLFIIASTYFYLIKKKQFKKSWKKLIENKDNLTIKLLLYNVVLVISIFGSGYILEKESVVYGESMKIGIYIILMGIISFMINKDFDFYSVLGIVFLVMGLFLIENKSKK